MQVLRFSQHHLELVSREEYRLGRPVEVEEEDEGEEGGERRGREGGEGGSGEKEYGLIVRKRKLVQRHS